MNCNYYSVFNAGFKVPKDFIDRINDALNNKLIRFLALKSESENGLVGQVHVHKKLGGNRDKTFIDKLSHTTRSQGCPELVKDLVEIVPSMIQG